jgi:hypothetical protein
MIFMYNAYLHYNMRHKQLTIIAMLQSNSIKHENGSKWEWINSIIKISIVGLQLQKC